MAAANRVELGERYRRSGAWIGAASHASNPGRPRLQDTAERTYDEANQICHDLQGAMRNPMDDDEIEHRIEAFDAANGGGVGWYKDKSAYHLYLLDTEAPIARLKPTGTNDEIRSATGHTVKNGKTSMTWEDASYPSIRHSTTSLQATYSGHRPDQNRTKSS